ncbi:peptide ABC transporter substrate-binding protein [Gloeocapsa sp. PCC 73106]|uniref:peptide ABC transporter substrate-binding protein n=1 Tax=Gloeocapsa sp. PCC 73106 TaxID=102232 RepID=UPI0002ACE896|nr:peptide ABC transporter substrate-binding protein [Gloeocapsa sp. PCC 73106]ELR99903.1 ABC-type dipeptide transport system, periplasmic component [Gloeocapsa sp. PCC 73106]
MLKIKTVLLFLLSLVLSVSCTFEPQVKLDDGILRLLYWQAPTILNPHLSTGFKDYEASRITLEPLASYDQEGNLVVFLAAEAPSLENGGVAPDGKSVTWKLKQGLKWSDGKPFTAADVVFTYQYISNPEVASNTAGTYEIIESVEAIDDYTVKINFKNVNPAWFLVFVGVEGMILPSHQFTDYNGANARQAPANQSPVGTGPYRVVEFKPGDTVIYEPNPEFRDQSLLAFKRIELKGGGDATSAARAVLQTQEADFAYNLQVEANILDELAAAGQGQVLANFGATMERILINHSDPNPVSGERSDPEFPHPFFQDTKVRQAFNLAIDRDTIAQELYGVTGKATANVLVGPEIYNSPNTSFEFNLAKANSLLDETGWLDSNNDGTRDKNGVEMKIIFQTSVNPLRQKTQQIVKQNLREIGVETELKSIDPSIFFSGDPASTDTIERFYADLQMYSTGNTNPDPSAYLQSFTCASIPKKSNNWSGDNTSRYCNPSYDKLWQKSIQELNVDTRRNLLIEMNDLLVNEGVLIPLVHRADVIGISNRLSGVEMTAWDLRTWNIQNWKRTS